MAKTVENDIDDLPDGRHITEEEKQKLEDFVEVCEEMGGRPEIDYNNSTTEVKCKLGDVEEKDKVVTIERVRKVLKPLVPKIKEIAPFADLYIGGSLADEGYSSHDVDIIFNIDTNHGILAYRDPEEQDRIIARAMEQLKGVIPDEINGIPVETPGDFLMFNNEYYSTKNELESSGRYAFIPPEKFKERYEFKSLERIPMTE